MVRKIIGLTGPIGSGKTTASKILQENGFVSFTFSDIIKEEAVKRGLPTDVRSILQDIGDELRKKHGNSILAKRLFEKIQKSGSKLAVVDGIRNVGELNYVKKKNGFIIATNSSIENRFRRTTKKGGFYYGRTRKEFQKDELRDEGVGQKSFGQHSQECLDAADIVINNNGTVSEFKNKLLKVIKVI